MKAQNQLNSSIKPVSRRKATVVNLIYQYAMVGLAFIRGILLIPLYLRYIDSTLYGAWLASGSIVTWLLLADMGLSNVLRQQTGKAYGGKNFTLLGKIIGTGLVCIVTMGLIPMLLSFACAPFLPKLFSLSGIDASKLSQSFILAGISSSLVIISGGAGAVQQGLQRNIYYGIAYLTGALLGIVTTVLMLIYGYGLISIPAGFVFGGVVCCVLCWSDIFYFCYLRLGIKFVLAKKRFKEMLRLTSWTFFDRLFYQLFARCDALVIGIILGPSVTIIYVLTFRSWELLKMILERISIAFMPSLAHLYGEGNTRKFNDISQRMMRISIYALVLTTGLCTTLNKTFVNLWFGSEFYAGATFDFLMAGAFLPMIFQCVAYHVLFARGNIKSLSAFGAILSISRGILLIVAVWFVRHLGPPVSLLLGFGVAAVVYYGPQWVKNLTLSKAEFSEELFRFGRAFLIAILLAFVFRTYFVEESWVYFIVCGLAYLLITCGVLLVIDGYFRVELCKLITKGYREVKS